MYLEGGGKKTDNVRVASIYCCALLSVLQAAGEGQGKKDRLMMQYIAQL
jgi:hypothetical protein